MRGTGWWRKGGWWSGLNQCMCSYCHFSLMEGKCSVISQRLEVRCKARISTLKSLLPVLLFKHKTVLQKRHWRSMLWLSFWSTHMLALLVLQVWWITWGVMNTPMLYHSLRPVCQASLPLRRWWLTLTHLVSFSLYCKKVQKHPEQMH